MTAERAYRFLKKEVEDRYIEAELGDLEPEIKEQILADGDIYLWGDVGVGKTYAMAALVKHYILKGYNCKCVNFDELCKLIRRTYTTNESELDTIYPIINVDKLFIDDLGLRSTPESDFAYGTLYSIFNKRQERYLPTYITSNKTIKEIGLSFDLRIADRLKWAMEIEMKGDSRRAKRWTYQ